MVTIGYMPMLMREILEAPIPLGKDLWTFSGCQERNNQITATIATSVVPDGGKWVQAPGEGPGKARVKDNWRGQGQGGRV